jgi:hypothetical protein
MTKRHFTKNFYKKRTRDFYRRADQLKKKPVVEHITNAGPADRPGRKEG